MTRNAWILVGVGAVGLGYLYWRHKTPRGKNTALSTSAPSLDAGPPSGGLSSAVNLPSNSSGTYAKGNMGSPNPRARMGGRQGAAVRSNTMTVPIQSGLSQPFGQVLSSTTPTNPNVGPATVVTSSPQLYQAPGTALGFKSPLLGGNSAKLDQLATTLQRSALVRPN